MNEIEVKIFGIDKDALIAKLEALGAEKIGEWAIQAEFYRNEAGKKIRLRRMGTQNILTYKQKIPTEEMKGHLELELAFDRYDTMCSILECVGFNRYGSSSKDRIGYRLGNIVYDFDKLPGIPWFVEIESDNEYDVSRGVELLGYSMQDTNMLTERGVKEYYGIA